MVVEVLRMRAAETYRLAPTGIKREHPLLCNNQAGDEAVPDVDLGCSHGIKRKRFQVGSLFLNFFKTF